MRGTVKRSPFVCLLLAGFACPAFADDLTITTVITTPVATSKAKNDTPGNIAINSGAGVSINAAGAAVTLDSNNTIDSQGSITNNFAGGGAIAVHVVGGFTGSLISEGTTSSIISVSGWGAGKIGVLLDGTTAFTGGITLGSGSKLFSHGGNTPGVGLKTRPPAK